MIYIIDLIGYEEIPQLRLVGTFGCVMGLERGKTWFARTRDLLSHLLVSGSRILPPRVFVCAAPRISPATK